jgi:hypothetical protein
MEHWSVNVTNMPSIIMLHVIVLSVISLNGVMLSIMAPFLNVIKKLIKLVDRKCLNKIRPFWREGGATLLINCYVHEWSIWFVYFCRNSNFVKCVWKLTHKRTFAGKRWLKVLVFKVKIVLACHVTLKRALW